MKSKNAVTFIPAALLAFPLLAGTASAADYAPWLRQIGVSGAVLSAANGGRGQLLGVVDSGIAASHPVFAPGQVSTAMSGCAAVSFRCANGVVDDNSHGTAVAAIAAANRVALFDVGTPSGTYRIGVMGVAPNANILAQKVMDAAGAGYTTDVANGIVKAANAGATVINLSLTFVNSPDLVAAINYAAAKGSFIVWAGGNKARVLLGGADTAGLTPAAINRLVLAGSVDSRNALSSFSNTPGSGALVNTRNAKTAYANRWIMAPGESIFSPYASGGNEAWAAWSGTSMSTPLVSGALMLLQSTWPILRTHGTAANLMLATATDLGARGTDTTYGTGMVNLAAAFRPYGTLAVTQANGAAVAVPRLTGSMISSGALGPLSSVQSMLSNYTAFDGYARNFSVNLSGLIRSSPTPAINNALPVRMNTGPVVMRLADGRELAYMPVAGNPAARLGAFGMVDAVPDRRIGYGMLTDRDGATTAIGYGFPVQFSYAKALYGDDDMARLSSDLGVAGLTGLAQGGGMLAYGTRLAEKTRLAVAWSNTASAPGIAAATTAPDWATARAANLSVGLVHQFDDRIMAGITFGALNERHGLLGSTYDAGAPVSFGSVNRTRSTGLSLGLRLDRDSSVLFEGVLAWTGAATATGLIAGTTDIRARAYGMTYMNKNVFTKGDSLLVAVKQPLRVVAGTAAVVMPAVDSETGLASFGTAMANLVPNGRETEYKVAYSMPLAKRQTLSLHGGMRTDVLNVQGSNDASIGIGWSARF